MRQKDPAGSFLLLLAAIPVVFSVFNSLIFREKLDLVVLLAFVSVNIVISIFLLRRSAERRSLITTSIEHTCEEINIINTQIKKTRDLGEALLFKISRYSNLKKLIEDLNLSLKTDTLIRVLSSAVYSLISGSRGIALFYLVDNQYQKLKLVYSIKDDNDLVVLTKEGDIFDQWVLRHSTQLIIEDLKNDFRFDFESIRLNDMRPVLSLISSPLITHNSLLGLLRLESSKSGSFNQDDLRFLALVADLGAVALENSLLFQKKQELAIHDDLTGLYTRHYFIGRLKDEVKRAQRLDQYLSLMMIDIDFFKQYNDKFGHTAGDIVLKKVGLLLKNSLREFNPLLCRFGGEEFLVMLPGMNKERSENIAGQLRKDIEKETIVLRRNDTHITVSIGVASLPLDTKDEDELVQKADKAMYKAKEKGRNRVCCI